MNEITPNQNLPAEMSRELEEYAKESLISEGHMSSSYKYLTHSKGIFKYEGKKLESNEMIIVVLDHVLLQTHYKNMYKKNSIDAPSCYAISRKESELKAHDSCEEPVYKDGCLECPYYQWESSQTGKGKRCQTRRRLAIIKVGDFDEQGKFSQPKNDIFINDNIAYLQLPVTSVSGFSKYVRNVATLYKRPLFGVYTRMRIGEGHGSAPYTILFNTIEPIIGADQLKPIKLLHDSIKKDIMHSYQKFELNDKQDTQQPKPVDYTKMDLPNDSCKF